MAKPGPTPERLRVELGERGAAASRAVAPDSEELARGTVGLHGFAGDLPCKANHLGDDPRELADRNVLPAAHVVWLSIGSVVAA